MAPFTTAIIVASAGNLSIASGSTVSFTVTWGSNISSFRWSRIWPAIQSAADSDIHQSVTIVAEGSQWDAPGSIAIAATLRGDSQLGAPIVANIEVLASQVDTF